jgi:hypothetical protein
MPTNVELIVRTTLIASANRIYHVGFGNMLYFGVVLLGMLIGLRYIFPSEMRVLKPVFACSKVR